MKVKQNLFPALLVALALTACNNEEETMQGADGRIALQVTSGIQTRAYDNQWETGDRIGIYAFGKGTTTVADGYGNIPYTTASGGTTGSFAPDGTTIYLPTDGTERDFVAYYPYTAGLTDGIYTVDVSNQSSQKVIDLMAAATQTADRTNPNVAFNFTHKLCKMELTLKPGSGMTGTELAGLTVELTGQRTAGTFDVTRPASGVEVATEGTVSDITLLTDEAGTSTEGIVLPADSYEGMAFRITLADGESVFTWSLSEAKESTGFTAGSKYLYTIRVNKTDIRVTSTITDWTTGNGDGETGSAE